MLIVGLTGPSGAGKARFCAAASEFEGVVSIDTDLIARSVVQKGEPCLKELCEAFGERILNPDGTLDRSALASIAFSDEKKHGELNRITHKYILNDVRALLEKAKKDGVKMCIIDAPLLFESGADRMCDVSVAAVAEYSARLRRIMNRDGISEKQAKTRMDAQPNEEFYRRKCSYVIENNGSDREMLIKSARLIRSLLGVQN